MGGIAVLLGRYDGETVAETAVMVNDASGWAFGPLFTSTVDAREQVEAFLKWLREARWAQHRAEVFPSPSSVYRLPGRDGNDPRDFTEAGVEALVAFWRKVYLDLDGELLDPLACAACLHIHSEAEGGGVGDCAQTIPAPNVPPGEKATPLPCPCTAETWKAGNRVSEIVYGGR